MLLSLYKLCMGAECEGDALEKASDTLEAFTLVNLLSQSFKIFMF